MYYCFITSTNNIASEMNIVAERNGRLIPSIGDMYTSTPMLVKHGLDSKWSTVNVTGNEF